MQDESRALDSRKGGELETLATEIRGLEEQLASGETTSESPSSGRTKARQGRPTTFAESWEEER